MKRRKGLKEKGMLRAWWKKTTQNHMKRVTHGPPRLTLKEWRERLEEFNHCCAYCGEGAKPNEDGSPGRLELEHLTPLSRGGEHRKHNIVPACGTCNKEKGSMTLDEYQAKVTGDQNGTDV